MKYELEYENGAEISPSPSREWQRLAMPLFVVAGIAMYFGYSLVPGWLGMSEKEPFISSANTVGIQSGAEDFPASAVQQQLAFEQERQRGEVLGHQLTFAQEDLRTLKSQVIALTDEQAAAAKSLQDAQDLAAEHKEALDQERGRGVKLLRELASAREEVEAHKAAANAADASEKSLVARAAAEEEQTLKHQLASAQVDLETLKARLAAVTYERAEAEKALQTAQAFAAEQKAALDQERQRSNTLIRELASAREVQARTPPERNPPRSGVASTQETTDIGYRTSRSIVSGQGPLPNGQSPQTYARHSPKPRQPMLGREQRDTPRPNYSSIRLFGD